MYCSSEEKGFGWLRGGEGRNGKGIGREKEGGEGNCRDGSGKGRKDGAGIDNRGKGETCHG